MKRNFVSQISEVKDEIEALISGKYFIKCEGKNKITIFTPSSKEKTVFLDAVLKETPSQDWNTVTITDFENAVRKVTNGESGEMSMTAEERAALEKYIDDLIQNGHANKKQHFKKARIAEEDKKLRQSIRDECGITGADGDTDFDNVEENF